MHTAWRNTSKEIIMLALLSFASIALSFVGFSTLGYMYMDSEIGYGLHPVACVIAVLLTVVAVTLVHCAED